MKRERWAEVEQLYHAALEREPAARAAFLDAACAGDEEFCREVVGLLAYDDPEASFIQAHALHIAARALAANLPSAEETGMDDLQTLPIRHEQAGNPVEQPPNDVAAGGMGAVYEATDLRLGRRVAVKVLTGRLFGDQSALRRFEREARASARLNHLNIIAVYDYGRAGAEGAYLVMELVAGTTLRDALKSSGPLLPTVAATYFEQILAGLQAAHDAGVIHRDLKPENVLIARQEARQADDHAIICLLDFGLAKLRTFDTAGLGSPIVTSGLTTPGMVMGTFGYMSPEQLLGEEVDERTDIFAVGVMVVEALTGKRPFEGKSQAELLNAVLHRPFTLPGNAPAVRRLDAVLQKCLAKERAHRYATVAELQSELIPALKACPPLKLLGEFDTLVLPGN